MDFPYVIHYFLLLLLAYMYWKHPDAKYVRWAFLIEFVFIAFRAPVVGADTWNYVRYLDGERNFYNADSRELETGFLIYRQVLVTLQGSRFVYMLINSFLTCYPIYLLMKKYSLNVPLSLAMASIFDLYVSYFCALRQLLGLAILVLCILYVLKNGKYRWVIYCLGTILGWTFHVTIVIYSVLFVCAYFLRKINRKIALICIIGSAIIGIVLQSFDVGQIFDFYLSMNLSMTERIQLYLEKEETNVLTSIFQNLRPSIIAVLIFVLIDKNKVNHWFSVIYLMGVVIGNLFISVSMIHRITIGFIVFGPIVFSWIFSSQYYSMAEYSKKVNIILLLFFLYFSQAYVKNNLISNIDLTNSGRMHPYQFIWENYSQHPSIKYWGD